MPKPLAVDHELLLTHQELSGSREDYRTLRSMEPTFLQRKGPKDEKLVEEPKSFIPIPQEETGKDSSFAERRPSCIYQFQTNSRSVRFVYETLDNSRKIKSAMTFLSRNI
ncbi:hypothetical protein O181_035382 [Austropuccinia psidii MF-1]|uniref:Uncharacterized protein n=1 Tax=Austropuccinia psidii MF-1 TaxID=1389203 RepID=A0A9Q3D529_9BASI|nr:hypothetical protein [Austropuccinia psidii MF-1]